MNKYSVSIVIPTKNRQQYCIEAIKQILELGFDDLQICIQDNSDDDCLRQFIDGIHNDHVVYNYHAGVLSFVDNFSEAILLASGEYVCMIGDDDGILPSIMEEVYYARKHNLDAIIPGLNAIYYWPSSRPIVEKGENGCLVLIPMSKGHKRVDTKKSLEDLVRYGGLNYLNYDLAKVYHGLVRRKIFLDIKHRTGYIFDGLTPDLYMATALSLTCKKVVKTDYPISVSGICPTSGSTDSATGKHTGALKDAPHFRGHDNYEWDMLIPAFYSVETIWSESMLRALKNFHEDELISKFNVKIFDSFCLNRYPQFTDVISQHATSMGVDLIAYPKAKGMNLKGMFFKTIRKIKRGFKKSRRLYDIKSISDAVSEIIIYNKL